MNWTPKVRQYGILKTKGCKIMNKGVTSKRYTGEFKQKAVETMRAEKLSYCEASRRFGTTDKSLCAWERIYLEEGPKGLYIERQGLASAASGTRKGPKPKLPEKVKQDLIAENQYLRAENDYLKNLHALVSKRARGENGHK